MKVTPHIEHAPEHAPATAAAPTFTPAAAPAPAAFLLEHLPHLRAAPGPVLDLACGAGRNALAAARAGCTVIGLDRNAAALAQLCARAHAARTAVQAVRADVETGHGIPFAPQSFGAVLVFHFLFRPLAPEITRLLRPGGWLLYETFTTAQRTLPGGPRNPNFLLHPGELPRLFPTLTPIHHAEITSHSHATARLLARKPPIDPPA